MATDVMNWPPILVWFEIIGWGLAMISGGLFVRSARRYMRAAKSLNEGIAAHLAEVEQFAEAARSNARRTAAILAAVRAAGAMIQIEPVEDPACPDGRSILFRGNGVKH